MEVHGRVKRNSEGKYLERSGGEKEKESLKETGSNINYAGRRWMLQKSLKLWDCSVDKGFVRRYMDYNHYN